MKQKETNSGDFLKYGKVPPQAIDLEDAVIGACLLERAAFNEVITILPSEEFFYSEANRSIWKAMISLQRSGNVIDLLTVSEQLKKDETLDIVGGPYAIAKLTMQVVRADNIKNHAQYVSEKYMRRQLIHMCGEVLIEAYDDSNDIFDIILETGMRLSKIDTTEGNSMAVHIGSAFMEVLREMQIQKEHRTALTGLDTGIYELNEITNGWQKTDLIILGARPSKGKTSLALNFAMAAAISQIVKGVPVAFLSLEMDRKQLVRRMISMVTGIDFGKIHSGNLTDAEFVTVEQQTKFFNSLPIHIVDSIREWSKLVSIIRKLKEKYDIEMVIGDYIGLVKNKASNNKIREQQVSDISGDSKALAKELDIPFMWLSQLNRNVEGRGKGDQSEPQPSDLRESGSIEQDADLILFPWHVTPEDSRISIAKHRNGKTSVGDYAIKMKFIGSLQKWISANDASPFSETIREDNPRAGIVQSYENRMPYKDEDTPF